MLGAVGLQVRTACQLPHIPCKTLGHDLGAADPRRVGGGQEEGAARDVLGLADAPERNLTAFRGLALRALDAILASEGPGFFLMKDLPAHFQGRPDIVRRMRDAYRSLKGRGKFLTLVSPRDGSGVLSPALTYTLSDAASVQATLYVPWGAEPDGLTLRSDYGWTPLSAFVQLRLYD